MHHDLAEKSCDVASSGGLETLNLVFLQDVTRKREFDGCAVAEHELKNSRDPQFSPVLEYHVAYMHHTSGTSTGLPKPIPQTHRAAVGVLPGLSEGREKATFTTTPLYHGGIADCFRAWTSGALIWLFPGREVPITARNVVKSLEAAHYAVKKVKAPKVQYFSSVPYVLQMMAAEADGLRLLQEMEIVGVGGAALPQSVGDDLVKQGVNLVSRFGSAECGFLLSSHRRYETDKEWQYLRSGKSPYLSFQPREDGLAELLVHFSWPHMAERNRDDGSYATADLFERHPTIPSAWRYHSRADSQLTLATGKKFDPAPLESAIATSPLLDEVLIFGNGQQTPGALLFRSTSSAKMTDDGLLQSLWPNIERMNQESQSHARLSRNMLIVMSDSAPSLEKSSKGTILRRQAEKLFAAEITKAYESDLNDATASTNNGNHATTISDEAVPTAVIDIIKKVIGNQDSIPIDADLFSHGIDSIACVRIRALLQSRILASDAAKLPLNIVYDCGTIERISQYLLAVRKGGNIKKEDEIHQMNTYVSQYSTFHDLCKVPKGEVVVLTGATGALGAHILDQLRSSPRISKIHCLVRASSPTAANERVSKSLTARNKAPLETSSLFKISCHSYKLSDSSLGLRHPSTTADGQTTDLYTTLATTTTTIIHAAWAVNFSMRLSSFVKDHIAGLQNLINLALASPRTLSPRFIFCSSTASVLGPNAESPIPEKISRDPLSASPLGYSRSKWVAERMCEQAHLNTRLRDRISVLRIGQLCGDTESGIWNVTEAWPLMLSSVKVTKSLPDLKEDLDWLPVDIAAAAVVETALSDVAGGSADKESSEIPVLHILNPNPQTTWSDLLHWLKTLNLDFDILPPDKWVQRLEDLNGEDAKHPARKLLGLWKDAYVGYGKAEVGEKVVFEMERTRRAVSVMRDVQPIGERHFGKMWGWIEREMMGEEAEGKEL